MSSSDANSSKEESSPIVMAKPRKESGAVSELKNKTESADEHEDETEIPVKPKVGKALNVSKNKTYEKMVHEAMEKLNENKRIGVSIQRIIKYVSDNNDLASDRLKLFCKKAIDKGLKTDIYVHKSGVGMSGSIVFAANYWNDKKKSLKVIEKQEKQKKAAKQQKPKLKPKVKPNVEIKSRATNKPKPESKVKITQPQKDKNNNTTASKTTVKKSKKTMRLSIVASTVKGKPKMKVISGSKTSKKKANNEMGEKKGKVATNSQGKSTRSKTTKV